MFLFFLDSLSGQWNPQRQLLQQLDDASPPKIPTPNELVRNDTHVILPFLLGLFQRSVQSPKTTFVATWWIFSAKIQTTDELVSTDKDVILTCSFSSWTHSQVSQIPKDNFCWNSTMLLRQDPDIWWASTYGHICHPNVFRFFLDSFSGQSNPQRQLLLELDDTSPPRSRHPTSLYVRTRMSSYYVPFLLGLFLRSVQSPQKTFVATQQCFSANILTSDELVHTDTYIILLYSFSSWTLSQVSRIPKDNFCCNSTMLLRQDPDTQWSCTYRYTCHPNVFYFFLDSPDELVRTNTYVILMCFFSSWTLSQVSPIPKNNCCLNSTRLLP